MVEHNPGTLASLHAEDVLKVDATRAVDETADSHPYNGAASEDEIF